MKYNKAIDSYISYVLEPDEVKTTEDRPNSIFWVKDGKIITEIEESKDFWLRKDIWDSISRMFDLNYFETQSVIKLWLERHPNFGGLTPPGGARVGFDQLEQHHNLGELTPEWWEY